MATINNKRRIVYLVDGPCHGELVEVLPKAKYVHRSLTTNPFYKEAVYFITKQTSRLGEQIAIFSKCIKR